MRSCSKCGSYLPDGKFFCPACGRPVAGAATSHQQRTAQERSSTYTRIAEAFKEVNGNNRSMPRGNHPYAGNTYEQHKSHDPRSRDYYASKHSGTSTERLTEGQRIICAAAYFSFFFFLPLVMMPNSKAGRFHANQGLLLFILNLFIGFFATVFGSFFEGIPVFLMI